MITSAEREVFWQTVMRESGGCQISFDSQKAIRTMWIVCLRTTRVKRLVRVLNR
jgi:hypothetical protein